MAVQLTPQQQQAAANAVLNDPQAQQALLNAAQQHGGAALTEAQRLANDPEVQRKAKEAAAVAAAQGAVALGQAGDKAMALLQQGPAGLRVLATFVGLASLTLAVISVINPFGAMLQPVTYLVSVYQVIFAIVMILMEANQDSLGQYVPKLESYSTQLQEQAKFLTHLGGRGLFYIFQGTLWLAFMGFSLEGLMMLAVGGALCFVGSLYIAMHYGIMPQECMAITQAHANKLRGGAASAQAASGYQPVAQSA